MAKASLQLFLTKNRSALLVSVLLLTGCMFVCYSAGLGTFLPFSDDMYTGLLPRSFLSFRGPFAYLLGWSLHMCLLYLLLESNNKFAFIRLRTLSHGCLYLLFVAAFPLLHTFGLEQVVVLITVLSAIFLYSSYHVERSSGLLFHSMLLLCTASVAAPPLLFLLIPFFSSARRFRSLNVRSFVACLLGIAFPLCANVGFYLYSGRTDFWLTAGSTFLPVNHLFLSPEVRYAEITLWAGLLLGFLCAGIHFVVHVNEDKIRTRSYLWSMFESGLFFFLCWALYAPLARVFAPLAMVCTALFVGHYISVCHTRFSRVFTLCLLLLLLCSFVATLCQPSFL